MLVEGSVYPPKIQIVNYKKGDAIVKLRRNITEKEIENEDGSTDIIYEYEETEIILVNRNNLEGYIEDNFDMIFEAGLESETEHEETIEERIERLEQELEELKTQK